MSIVERLKGIADKIGVPAKGNTVQEILTSIENGLNNKKPQGGRTFQPAQKPQNKTEED